VQARYAAVEPEASDGAEISSPRCEVKQDADVVAAGLVDEIIKVFEGAKSGIDRLGLGRIGLEGGEEECVDAKGMEVVEAFGEAVKGTTFRGTEVGGIYVVDDGVLPPGVGAHAGAGPARTGESL
jgi:hypothetical protein